MQQSPFQFDTANLLKTIPHAAKSIISLDSATDVSVAEAAFRFARQDGEGVGGVKMGLGHPNGRCGV